MRWLPAADFDRADEVRAAALARVVGFFGLGLVAATWRLWTPQQAFPQVPFFHVLDRVPAPFQWAAAVGMVLGLLLAAFAPRVRRLQPTALLLFAASTLGLVLLDQERLQPWAYQFMLLALALALAPARGAVALLRLLVISFYFHSAITKFDASFLQSLGQQFLAALGDLVGVSLDDFSQQAREMAAGAFPLGELLIAVGLCFARTRGVALAAALLLHVLLLVILGPWGLDHKPGVLVWNLFFMVQDVLLFWKTSPALEPAESVRAAPHSWMPAAPWPVRLVIFAAVVFPLLSSTSWFDLWPSWGLYASSAQRVQLFVHRRALPDLPEDIRALVEEPADASEVWLTLRLDRWSLAALSAPIYPQNRFQLGVARAVIVRYGLGHRARVFRFSLAERFTGARHYDLLESLSKIDAAESEYFFNSRPRQNWFAPPDEPVSRAATRGFE